MRIMLFGQKMSDPHSHMTGPERVFYNLTEQLQSHHKLMIVSTKNLFRFIRTILFERADVYHSFQVGVSNVFALFLIQFILRKPFYYTIHGLVKEEIKKGSKLKKHHLIVEWLLLTLSSRLVAVSEDLKTKVLQNYRLSPAKIVIIGNGVEEHFLQVTPQYNIYERLDIRAKKIIFTASGTQATKGILPLLKSFVQLPIKDAALIIAGPPGNCHLEALEIIDDREDIYYIGNLPREDLHSAYYHAYLYVQYSVYDTFGIAPLEAMATGTPALISENVHMKEILERQWSSEVVVPFSVSNHQPLTNVLEDLLCNVPKRRRLGELAKMTASKHTWAVVAGKYHDFWVQEGDYQ